jgi:hypothetical protein
MRRPWVRVLVLLSIVAARIDAALGADAPAVDATKAAVPPAIADSRARDYVGQNVTIEGRVAGIHESPLATVLAFSPNFAGFTATILAADREKFPSDLAARVRDRTIRVSGTVTAYRGKPEMALRDPSQLVLAPPPAPGAVNAPPPVLPVATSDPVLEDIRRALARIEAHLQSLEGRVSDLEQEPIAAAPAEAPPQRAPTLTVGTPASEVERVLGRPTLATRGPNGQTVWSYSANRSVTFDAGGRVRSWTGF